MPTITFDQVGLSAGVAGESRSDGLSTGALVTVTTSEAGTVELLHVARGDVAAVGSLSQASTLVWTFTPTIDVYGTYRVRFTATSDGHTVVRLFAIRTPNKRLRIPALNELADPEASLVNAGPDQVEASENNEGGSYSGWLDTLEELFVATEAAGSASPGDFLRAAERLPDPRDFEARKATNPDLSANGWTVALRDSPFTALVYDGPVDRSIVGAAAGKYKATLFGGLLVLQLPSNQPVQIYRAVSGSFTLKTHARRAEFISGNSNYSFISTGVQFVGAGTETFYYVGNEANNNVAQRWVGPGGGAYTGDGGGGGGLGAISERKMHNVQYIDHDPGVLSRFFSITSDGVYVMSRTTGFNIPQANYAGVWLTHNDNHFSYLDFIRIRPLNTYP